MYVLTRIDPPYQPGQNPGPIIAQGFVQQDGGYVTVTTQDGCVLSIQPDGTVQHRVAGTNGTYEIAARVGNQLSYCPDGGHAITYGYLDQLPNAQPIAPPADVPPENHVQHQSLRQQIAELEQQVARLERGQGVAEAA